MTIENLLSGLIGGVIGGVLGLSGGVVLAIEQRFRWWRENKAATMLVGSEVTFNLYYLDKTKTDAVGVPALVTMAAWEAERVRIASFLNLADLRTVVAAYTRIGAFIHMRAGGEAFVTYVFSPQGREAIDLMMKDLVAAETVLRARTGQSVSSDVSENRGWLGIGPAGRIRLG